MKYIQKNLVIFVFVVAFLMFPVFYSQASTIINADVTGNTVWDMHGSPYIISNSIQIPQGSKLTINKGVVVQFSYGTEIDVSGSVVANSPDDKNIYFTSIADTTLLKGKDNHNNNVGTPLAGDYNGFVFNPGSNGAFNNVEMRYANLAISSSNATLSVTNSNFINNNQPLMIDYLTHFTHQSNTFSSNSFNGIGITGDLFGSDYTFTNGDAPYVLFSNPNVSAGNTLTIENGVTLQSADGALNSIFVTGGALSAIGTSQNNFDRNDDDSNNPSGITLNGVNIQAYNHATLNLNNVTISNFGTTSSALTIFNDATAVIKNTTIDTGGDGITAFNHASIDADHLTIKNCSDGGIISFGSDAFAFTNIKLRNSEITANGFGMYPVDHTTVDISNNSIHGNGIGVINNVGSTYDFSNNWWGDKSGPYNLTSNPTGTGNEVFDGIVFKPWLMCDPLALNHSSNTCFNQKHDDDKRGHYSNSDKNDIMKHVKDRDNQILKEKNR